MEENKPKISYTAVVLDQASIDKLLGVFQPPEGWEVICHHMTINMGPADKGPAADMVGQTVSLTLESAAIDYELGVMAAGVTTDVPSKNDVKHITIAVNRAAGAKPFFSNKLTEWIPMPGVPLSGKVTEVPQP